ncbi:MAG: hypothetical protein HKN50_07700 [Gammaproteobacteria bacterium]|nr:hypothetical protein [Gammaproteobacteria bacterium]
MAKQFLFVLLVIMQADFAFAQSHDVLHLSGEHEGICLSSNFSKELDTPLKLGAWYADFAPSTLELGAHSLISPVAYAAPYSVRAPPKFPA